MTDHELLIKLFEKMEGMEKDIKEMKPEVAKIAGIEQDVKEMKLDIEDLKDGQKDIQDLIGRNNVAISEIFVEVVERYGWTPNKDKLYRLTAVEG